MRPVIAALLLLLFFRAAPAYPFAYEDPTILDHLISCSGVQGDKVQIQGLCLSWNYVDKGHHFGMSWKATKNKGFSSPAAFSVAWNADMIDLYGYSPPTYMSALARLQAHYAIQVDTIKNMHFDDLYSTAAIECTWNRYLYRTFAGLLWAKEKWEKAKSENDQKGIRAARAAAYLLLGISFHAFEDFYAHSIWINEKNRRNRTWFEVPTEEKHQMTLWTGAYEHPVSHGIKHHGEIMYSCTVYNKLPSWLLTAIQTVGCSGVSPLSGNKEGFCRDVEACKTEGHPATFTVGSDMAIGAQSSGGLLFAMPGINVDARWTAGLGVQTRELTDITGDQAFETAYALAQRTAEEWLDILDVWMAQAGAGDFWNELKQEGAVKPGTDENEIAADMHAQWIEFNTFPVAFPAWGPYPPDPQSCAGDQQYYLRMQLKTANDSMAGTDSEIYLKTNVKDKNNNNEFLLDYLPGTVSFYSDFEKGDDTVYWAGPFSSWPSQITLENRAAGVGDVLGDIWNKFTGAVGSLVDVIGDVMLSLVGGHDDYVAENHKTWKVSELKVPEQPVDFELNGDDQSMGHYQVSGVLKTTVTNEQIKIQLLLTKMVCIKESSVDQASDPFSDEPYIQVVLASLPGGVQGGQIAPLVDVNTGDTRSINLSMTSAPLPANGMLGITVVQMENDSQGEAERKELLDKLVGAEDKKVNDIAVRFGSLLAADWKLTGVEVAGFSNGVSDYVSGTVLTDTKSQWVEAGKSVSFNLPKPKAWALPILPGFAPPDASPLKEAVVTEATKDHVLLEITYDKKPQDFPASSFLGAYPVDAQGNAVKPSGVTFKFKPVSFSAQGGKATVEIQCQRTSSSQISTAGFNVILYEPRQDPKVAFRYSYPYIWKN